MVKGAGFMSVDDDGTFSWGACPGWEGYRISGRAALVKDRPVLLSVSVEPLDPEAAAPLSSVRLAALPLAELATLALHGPKAGSITKVARAMRSIERRTEPKHDPRAIVTVEQVVEAWKVAEEAGLPPRSTVASQLHIGERTVSRYMARAREAESTPTVRLVVPEPGEGKVPRRPSTGRKGERA